MNQKPRWRWWYHFSWSKGHHAGWQGGLAAAIALYDEQHEGPPGAARKMLVDLHDGNI